MSATEQALRLRNPYLEVFGLYCERRLRPWPEWEARTAWRDGDGFTGPAWEQHMTDTINTHMARRILTERCAWAIPNTAAIRAIAALNRPVVEIGAGNGYWAWLLEQAGVDVLAFDSATTEDENHWCACDHWTNVRRGDSSVLEGMADRALMLCWPPMSSLAYDCLQVYEGDLLIYVGEGEGGCCASDEFFNQLPGTDWDEDYEHQTERSSAWRLETEVEIPQWPGIHDYLTTYRRAV